MKEKTMHLANSLSRLAARFGLLALLSTALATPAYAALLTYSQFFNFNFNSTVLDEQFPTEVFDPTRLVPDFTLPRFDASLGTLQSVNISFNSFYVHSLIAFATDDFAENTNFITCNVVPGFPCFYENDALVSVIFNSSMTLELFDPQLTATLNVGQQQVFCSGSTDEDETVQCHDSVSRNGFFNGTLDAASVPLTSFIGTNPLGFGWEANFSLFGNCDHDDHADNCLVDIAMPWAGTLFLSYEYSEAVPGGGEGGGGGGNPPTDLPEPGPLGLLAAALAGLFARRRGMFHRTIATRLFSRASCVR
jgi:hypothetical protein